MILPIRRVPSDAHWRMYQSPQGKFHLSLRGDIYLFLLEIGPFSIGWEKT